MHIPPSAHIRAGPAWINVGDDPTRALYGDDVMSLLYSDPWGDSWLCSYPTIRVPFVVVDIEQLCKNACFESRYNTVSFAYQATYQVLLSIDSDVREFAPLSSTSSVTLPRDCAE